ncbi:MAG: hypothetical protein AB8H47_10755, partial [Bacteroidia bacterium]
DALGKAAKLTCKYDSKAPLIEWRFFWCELVGSTCQRNLKESVPLSDRKKVIDWPIVDLSSSLWSEFEMARSAQRLSRVAKF